MRRLVADGGSTFLLAAEDLQSIEATLDLLSDPEAQSCIANAQGTSGAATCSKSITDETFTIAGAKADR